MLSRPRTNSFAPRLSPIVDRVRYFELFLFDLKRAKIFRARRAKIPVRSFIACLDFFHWLTSVVLFFALIKSVEVIPTPGLVLFCPIASPAPPPASNDTPFSCAKPAAPESALKPRSRGTLTAEVHGLDPHEHGLRTGPARCPLGDLTALVA